MHLPRSIFRSYDIRGVYPTDLNEEYALHIGKALGTIFKHKGAKNIVVGRDDRESSPSLSSSLIEGLLSTGLNVTNTGITLTPVIHFLTYSKAFDGGINVTASHNPKEFNGFRIDYTDAIPMYGKDLQNLYEICAKEKYEIGKGKYSEKDLSNLYVNFIKKIFGFKKKQKIIVDCGSGATSVIGPHIFSELGQDVIPVYCNYDSNFVHGVPDPENKLFMQDLSQKVREHNADVGFAFDTDGDRFGVVDEKGTIYDNDKLLLLFAQDLLKRLPGSTIVYDVKCSNVLKEVVTQLKGTPKMIRTGHPYFVWEMKQGSKLGAEFSGHTYFSDKYFGYDDGVYAACRVLEILNNSNQKLSELMEKFPKRFHTSEIKVDCHDARKFNVVEKIKELVKSVPEFKDIYDVDGVRVQITQSGWFLVRASNTSPYLSLRLEGETEKEISFIIQQVSSMLNAFKLDPKPVLNATVFYS